MRWWLLIPAVFALGCGDKDGVDDSEEPDEGDSHTEDTEDTEAEVQTQEVTFTVTDGTVANTPLAGLTLTDGTVSATTGADGKAILGLPELEQYHVWTSNTGYLDLHLFGYAPEEASTMSRSMLSLDTAQLLLGAFELTGDPSKGVVMVKILKVDEAGGLGWMEGATMDLGASYDASIVFDADALYKYSPGNTSLVGSPSIYYFINVEEGEVEPSITPPDGYTCSVFGSEVEAGDSQLASMASVLSTTSFQCKNW